MKRIVKFADNIRESKIGTGKSIKRHPDKQFKTSNESTKQSTNTTTHSQGRMTAAYPIVPYSMGDPIISKYS